MCPGNDDTVGAHLHLAMYWYCWAALHYPTDPIKSARESGCALGHAFRAAELAFEMGAVARPLQSRCKGMKE